MLYLVTWYFGVIDINIFWHIKHLNLQCTLSSIIKETKTCDNENKWMQTSIKTKIQRNYSTDQV